MDNCWWILIFNLFAIGFCERKAAECLVKPNNDGSSTTNDVQGTVIFKQESESADVEVDITLTGFNTTDEHTKHGFHIHQEGDIIDGCTSAGGHYDPDNNTHGDQTDDKTSRHAGDLGNVEEDPDGNVDKTIMDSYISLQGTYNVIGRAIVVHLKEDTLDESVDEWGGAGPRISCCVITETETDSAHTLLVSVKTLLFGLLIVFYGYIR